MKKIITLLFALSFLNCFSQTMKPQNKKNKEILIATAHAGFSWRVAKSPDGITSEQKQYLKELKSGAAFDLGLYYRINDNAGVGLNYNLYKSSNSLPNQQMTSLVYGTTAVGTLSEDVSIFFIGPSFMFYDENPSSKHEGTLHIAMGYIGYKDNLTALENYKLTGGNFGMTGSFGYKYRITKKIAIGPQLTFVGGVIKKMKIDGPNGYQKTLTLEKDEMENLWHIDLSIGAVFRL